MSAGGFYNINHMRPRGVRATNGQAKQEVAILPDGQNTSHPFGGRADDRDLIERVEQR